MAQTNTAWQSVHSFVQLEETALFVPVYYRSTVVQYEAQKEYSLVPDSVANAVFADPLHNDISKA